MASTGSQNICYRSLSIPLLEYAFSHQSHAHYMNLGESHISCPVGFSALKGVSLAPSSRTQCWAGGKVGKHRKDALGVKAGPEGRAEPREAQPEAHGSPKVGSFRGCFWCWTLYWIFFIFSRFRGFGLPFFLSSQLFFCWAVHPFEADADQEAFSRCLCHFIVTEASTHLLSFFTFKKCFHCE